MLKFQEKSGPEWRFVFSDQDHEVKHIMRKRAARKLGNSNVKA